MGFLNAVKYTLKAIGGQLTASSPPVDTREVYFTNNFVYKAKGLGLSEKDALDVYYHGQDRKGDMRCLAYNGYELCIYHGTDKASGQPYISTIWKRDRR